jgi:hypothetical protein
MYPRPGIQYVDQT